MVSFKCTVNEMTESEIVNFPHLHGNRLIVYILQLIPVLSSVCFQKYKQFLKKTVHCLFATS